MFFRSKGKKPEEEVQAPPAPVLAGSVRVASQSASAKPPLSEPVGKASAAAMDADRKRSIAIARKKSVAFGQVVAVMARSEPHRNLPIGEVRWLVAPPVRSGQFMLAGKRTQKNGMVVPTTALIWARVSDEIDKQLTASIQHVRLAPKAWTSGENVWLIEAVGDPALVPEMIERLGAKEWKGKTVKIRSRQSDGSLSVHAIGPL